MPLVTRNLPTIALLLLTGSEAMILQWALLATGRATLSVQGFVAAMAILALLNAGLVFAMRRRPRRGPLAWVDPPFIDEGCAET